MKTAKDYTNYLNPGQTTVGSSDFPLYYLKKKIQSACPATFSKLDYFSFSGGLHIEQTSYNVHGDLIKGTSLVDIVKQSELSVIGLQTAVADVNDIKKARYIIQVLATCLYTLLQEAYIASSSELSLVTWAKTQNEDMYKYWYGVLNHELTTLMLVRSFRECNMGLMMGCCEKLVELCFFCGPA